jgi:hypothetical protein
MNEYASFNDIPNVKVFEADPDPYGYEEQKDSWTLVQKDAIDEEMFIHYRVQKNDSLLRISFLSGMSEK